MGKLSIRCYAIAHRCKSLFLMSLFRTPLFWVLFKGANKLNSRKNTRITRCWVGLGTTVMMSMSRVKRQKAFGKAAPNDPAHTARGIHCTRCYRFKPYDRQNERQTPQISVTIVSISCIQCSLKTLPGTAIWWPSLLLVVQTVMSQWVSGWQLAYSLQLLPKNAVIRHQIAAQFCILYHAINTNPLRHRVTNRPVL